MSNTDKTVIITQSNYIPWKGYFDMVNSADVMVLFDEMQYTRRDWRNRNKIKTPNGLKWLSVPVEVKGKFDQKINETKLADQKWIDTHYKSLQQNYAKAPFFSHYKDQIKAAYELCKGVSTISQVNRIFIEVITQMLGISTEFCQSSQFELAEDKTERLVNICTELGATK